MGAGARLHRTGIDRLRGDDRGKTPAGRAIIHQTHRRSEDVQNCYAAGIPHSGHKTGITWAAAIGAFLKNYEDGLICFRGIDDKVLKKAASLVKSNSVKIQIDRKKKDLHIDFTVFSENGKNARAVIEKTHTNLRSIHSSGKRYFPENPSNANFQCWRQKVG